MKPEKLSGVVPASVTPFGPGEEIDKEALLRLMNWNMSQGAESFLSEGAPQSASF